MAPAPGSEQLSSRGGRWPNAVAHLSRSLATIARHPRLIMHIMPGHGADLGDDGTGYEGERYKNAFLFALPGRTCTGGRGVSQTPRGVANVSPRDATTHAGLNA